MLGAAVTAIIVDLASWALGFYKKGGGGFLRHLRGDDLKALGLRWKQDPNEDRYVVERNRAWRKMSFDRLFASATKDVPTQKDIDDLADRLHAQFKQLHDDRNQYRAHAYESDQPKTAAMLTIEDVRKHLEACQELLADIRCLASNSQFDAYQYEPRAHDGDSDAQDVVDLVVCGPIFWIIDGDPGKGHKPDTFYVQKRDAYYERLHAEHDAAGSPAEQPFNRLHKEP
jgi:hypothetical protein